VHSPGIDTNVVNSDKNSGDQGAAHRGASLAMPSPTLQLVVRGFNAMEHSLLEGTVRLSQRRSPRLQLLTDDQVDQADVVMVDTRDARAMAWAQRQPTLADKTVIWVDCAVAPRGHTLAKRPIQWPILPMLLARALENRPGTMNGPLHPEPTTTQRPLLVVDDSLAVRAYMRSQLEARGYQVVDVDSAQAALDAVTKTAFACILMDVLMPGIDGYEGCKQIKARLRGAANVPVIMLTSKASPFDRIRGKMAGCDSYLTKPVDPKQLHETLALHVRAPARPAAPPTLTQTLTLTLTQAVATS
jgi:two-component system, cell cycle response regulator